MTYEQLLVHFAAPVGDVTQTMNTFGDIKGCLRKLLSISGDSNNELASQVNTKFMQVDSQITLVNKNLKNLEFLIVQWTSAAEAGEHEIADDVETQLLQQWTNLPIPELTQAQARVQLWKGQLEYHHAWAYYYNPEHWHNVTQNEALTAVKDFLHFDNYLLQKKKQAEELAF